MISHEFVTHWEASFPEGTYPLDHYLQHIEKLATDLKPFQFQEHLEAMIYWRTGMAYSYLPNLDISAPHRHMKLVSSLEGHNLNEVYHLFHNVVEAEDSSLLEQSILLRDKLKEYWASVIDRAYILHLAKPTVWPIIDQHTIRAFTALSKGEIAFDTYVDWDVWGKYVTFFNGAVLSSAVGNTLEGRSRVDRALYSWGISLKEGATKIHNDSFFENVRE